MAAAVATLGVLGLCAAGAGAAEEQLRFGRFGAVTLYRASARPAHVVLFVSGDGGWNLGVIDMARELASLDALVVGIDIRRLLASLRAGTEPCAYPAADLEALSKFVQKTLGYPGYEPPVLVGYSSGATLVYAVLVQAPTGTFRGAISLGFCPDLALARPLCRGEGGLAWESLPQRAGVSFLPAPLLQTPWVALQGSVDQVCTPARTEDFVRRVGHGEIVALPRVGHGFAVPRNWLPQFKEAFSRLVRVTPAAAPGEMPAVAAPPATVSGLPLVEVRALASRGALAVLLTGDGGWAGLDRELAAALAADGVPVVGLNTLQYFWSGRTPGAAAADLERILSHYLPAWGCDRAVLIGYSFGADVLPFMAARLPAPVRAKVSLIALIGPGREAHFEFHIADWLPGRERGGLPLLPEIQRLSGTPLLCFQGADERASLCPTIPAGLGRVVTQPGGHHFAGDYPGLAARILAALP